MTTPLQKHIADSLEKAVLDWIGKDIEDTLGEEYSHLGTGHLTEFGNGYQTAQKELQEKVPQLVVQLLSIARGEVEKKQKSVGTREGWGETASWNKGRHEAFQDVLDTLTITEK